MVETEKNAYLDRLVLAYLHQNNPLKILEEAPKQKRPKIFLENIGGGQQKDYIEDALNAYLTTSSPALPEGKVYVFTPTDSFRYDSAGGRVNHAGFRDGKAYGATFNEALNEIIEDANAGISYEEERSTHTNMLFFNPASLKKFEDALKRRLHKKSEDWPKDKPKIDFSYSFGVMELNIANYGKIRLYGYTIKSSPRPDK
jgi:hypothetical protein